MQQATIQLGAILRSPPTQRTHALLPDFVLHRRRDSTEAIGAGVVGHGAGEHLYAGVPARTVRSWRHRFADRADLLVAGLMAVAATWAGEAPSLGLPATPAMLAAARSERSGGRPAGEGRN